MRPQFLPFSILGVAVLGVAVLGVAVLGVAVLGVAVLGVAVLGVAVAVLGGTREIGQPLGAARNGTDSASHRKRCAPRDPI
jgi:hypothetical protein